MDPSVSPAAPGPIPGPRFTRLLFLVALALGGIAVSARLVHGLRTGDVPWIEMALPVSLMLMLTGITIGPRRPRLYYPVLAVSFVLLVASYVIPRHGRGTRASKATVPAAPVAAPTIAGTDRG